MDEDLGQLDRDAPDLDALLENRTSTDVPVADYESFFKGIKERVRTAQVRATLSVNSELVWLYWNVGIDILAHQRENAWGSRVVERLSLVLRREFSEQKGFSLRKLMYMCAFAELWPDKAIVLEPPAQTTEDHKITLLEMPLKSARMVLAFSTNWSS